MFNAEPRECVRLDCAEWTNSPYFMLEKIVSSLRGSTPDIRELVIQLAVEIAREGREGRRIGTLFTLGDADEVLARSRPLILDPIYGHHADVRKIRNADLGGTLDVGGPALQW